ARATSARSAVGDGFVAGGVQQFLDVSGVVRLDLEDPGGKGRFVDQVRRVFQVFVKSHDFAGYRRINVRGGLDRLDHARGLAGLELGADVEIADENEITQLFLGIVG